MSYLLFKPKMLSAQYLPDKHVLNVTSFPELTKFKTEIILQDATAEK